MLKWELTQNLSFEKVYPDYAGNYEHLQYARYSLKSLMISFDLVEGDWILIKYQELTNNMTTAKIAEKYGVALPETCRELNWQGETHFYWFICDNTQKALLQVPFLLNS